MSSLLKEAIVDAEALRSAALKSAENIVIEKYSREVRNTLEQILEQEEMPPVPEMPALDLGMEAEAGAGPEEVVEHDNIPLAATDNLSDMEGKNLSQLPREGEEIEVTIDLGALQEALQELQDSEEVEIDLGEATDAGSFAGEEAEEDEDKDDSAAALAGSAAAEEADSDAMKNAGLEEVDRNKLPGQKTPDIEAEYEKGHQRAAQAKKDRAAYEKENEDPWRDHFKKTDGTNENLDSIVDAIAEKLTVDLSAEISGWAGRPTSQLKHEQERELAGMQSDDVKEELEDLNKAQEKLVAENNQLKEQNDQYKQAIQELREGLHDVNLSNARLLYTNRVLRNTSLNERQKDKIVEAISSAGSVAEARMIHETLQSTVEAAPKRGPQSLSEAINRNRTSVIRATRHESTASDPFQDRMKKLAGIK
jgi:hypothetical protein